MRRFGMITVSFNVKIVNIFNLENIYYFENIYYVPNCRGGPDFIPSLLHSFTLHHFPLDIWKARGSSHDKKATEECSSENLNLTPMVDLRGRCLSFIISNLKRYHLKRNRFDY